MSEVKIRAYIEKNKEEFINQVALYYRHTLLYSFHSTTGVQIYIFHKYRNNPNKGDRLMMISRAFADFQEIDKMWRAMEHKAPYSQMAQGKYSDCIGLLEAIYKEHWRDIKQVIKSGEFIKPKFKILKIRNTQLLSELMIRGFTLPIDVKKPKGPGYALSVMVPASKITPDIELTWPHEFKTKEDAIIHGKRWAIGKTKITPL